MVSMRHYWEVDIGLSESAKNLTLDDLEKVILRSWKWKWPVSSKRLLLGPGGQSEQNVHHCRLTKSAPWPLTWSDLLGVIWRSRMWKSPITFWWCAIDIWFLWNTDGNLTPEVQNSQWPFTLIELYESVPGHTQIWHRLTFTGYFQGHESENRMYVASHAWEVECLPSDSQFNSMTLTSK